MTTTGELRPPTILGEFGEGYCRHCRFVEPLDSDGLLSLHGPGESAAKVSLNPCKGTGGKPWKLTPHRSKLAAFSSRAPYAICPACLERVIVTRYTHTQTIGRHFNGPAKVCGGVGRPIDPQLANRNHAGERG